jgi:NADPH:quinone reductase-like Zn-dependent oxidoreductase
VWATIAQIRIRKPFSGDSGQIMRAVRIYEYGGLETLKYELDAPDPRLGPEMVLIELVATSVNPIDWKIRSGARQKDFPLVLPAILGKDASGVVRAVGSAVHDFRPGDRVIALADATYAQYVATPAALVTHLPSGIDPIEAAAIPCVSLTGDQLVRLSTQAVAGQTILISGALGSVGRAAVHTAKKLGVKVIAGVRLRQLAEVESLGVFQAVALDDETAVAGLDALDGVADTIGGEIAAKLIGKVRAGGRFGYASVLPDDASARNPTVETSRVFVRPDPDKLREFADDIRDGKFILPISQRLPLREAAAAQDLMQKGGAGKIVLLL